MPFNNMFPGMNTFGGFNPQDLIYSSMREQGAKRARKAEYQNAMKHADWQMQRNALNNQIDRRGQLSGMFDSEIMRKSRMGVGPSMPQPIFQEPAFDDYQKSRGAYNTDQFKNFLEQLRLR